MEHSRIERSKIYPVVPVESGAALPDRTIIM